MLGSGTLMYHKLSKTPQCDDSSASMRISSQDISNLLCMQMRQEILVLTPTVTRYRIISTNRYNACRHQKVAAMAFDPSESPICNQQVELKIAGFWGMRSWASSRSSRSRLPSPQATLRADREADADLEANVKPETNSDPKPKFNPPPKPRTPPPDVPNPLPYLSDQSYRPKSLRRP